MTAIQAGMNKRIREKQTAIENRLFCTDLAQNETDLIWRVSWPFEGMANKQTMKSKKARRESQGELTTGTGKGLPLDKYPK